MHREQCDYCVDVREDEPRESIATHAPIDEGTTLARKWLQWTLMAAALENLAGQNPYQQTDL